MIIKMAYTITQTACSRTKFQTALIESRKTIAYGTRLGIQQMKQERGGRVVSKCWGDQRRLAYNNLSRHCPPSLTPFIQQAVVLLFRQNRAAFLNLKRFTNPLRKCNLFINPVASPKLNKQRKIVIQVFNFFFFLECQVHIFGRESFSTTTTTKSEQLMRTTIATAFVFCKFIIFAIWWTNRSSQNSRRDHSPGLGSALI